MATDAELDALIAESNKLVEETDRLLDMARKQTDAIDDWRKENGITADVMNKLDKALTPELRARLESDMEKAAIDDRHDLEREVEQAGAPKARPKPGRSYV